MENTIENKAKFFAQYYGQYIIRQPLMTTVFLNYHLNLGYDEIIKDGWIELTSLSDITDEDAIEVAKIFFGSDYPDASLAKEILKIELSTGHHGITGIGWIRVWDYLRSRGYALPWMGVSVEEQIKRGWIKLKTK